MKKMISSVVVAFSFSACAYAVDATDPLVPSQKVPPSQAPVTKTAVPSVFPNTQISLEMKDVPAHEALEKVFSQGNVPYNLPKGLPNRRISVQMKNVPWTEALNATVASAGLDYNVDEKGIVQVKDAVVKKRK